VIAFFAMPAEAFGALRPVNVVRVVVAALFFGMRAGVAFALGAVVGRVRDLALALESEVHRRQAAERRRDELAAHLVHDLKNPLVAISGHAELLEEGLTGSEHPETLQYVHLGGGPLAHGQRVPDPPAAGDRLEAHRQRGAQLGVQR
jgi:signal transduction histidine kinase